MQTIFDLSPEIQQSFRASYDLDEMTLHGLGSEDRRRAASSLPAPDAFEDGYQLRMAMVGVYSADTQREYETDCRRYDLLVIELNERYGDIVVSSDEAGPGGALGLRGYRVANTVAIERGTRRTDGTFDVTVENVAEELAAEDAAVRDNSRGAQPDA